MTERIFHISHTTTYGFDRLTSGLELTTRLRPPVLPSQRPLHTQVLVFPEAISLADAGASGAQDHTFRAPIDHLKVVGQTTLAHDPAGIGTASGTVIGPAPAPPCGPEPEAELDAQHPLIVAWARESLPESDLSPEDIQRFSHRIHRDFAFDRTATTSKTSLVEFFSGCRGVCEDYARLATACLRARGVVVRHVVGYLLPTEGRESSFGRKAHAWISCWLPGCGWIDLDPTTGLTVPERHVTLVRGYGREDTQPVSGRITDGQWLEQRISVDVSIVSA